MLKAYEHYAGKIRHLGNLLLHCDIKDSSGLSMIDSDQYQMSFKKLSLLQLKKADKELPSCMLVLPGSSMVELVG